MAPKIVLTCPGLDNLSRSFSIMNRRVSIGGRVISVELRAELSVLALFMKASNKWNAGRLNFVLKRKFLFSTTKHLNISLAFKTFLVLKIYHSLIVIFNIIDDIIIVIFIFIIIIIIIWLLCHRPHHHHHHHHHHHYHFHYYYFFIITLVWCICIRLHNQSSNYYVILKHLHSSAEQPSFFNLCAFPTFLFSLLTLLVTPWQAFPCFHPYPRDYYNNYMTPFLLFV